MKRLIMLCCAACVAIVVMLFVGCNAENEFATAEKIQALLSEKKVEEALALVKEVQLTHPLVLHNVAVACSAASARRRFDNSFDNSKNGNKREDPLATALEATAAELFLKAATKGDVDSQYEVFEHEKRKYDEKYKEVSERKNGLDKESALKALKIAPIALEMLEKAAKQGKGESDLLEIYRHGRYGIERDIPKAIKLIESRAEKSEAHALCARDMIEIGQCFMCVEDLGKAGEWFEKAAEWFETTEVQEPTALSSSYSSDCKELAEYLLAVKKWELAIKLYKKAATAKDARKDAMVALYDIYSKGEIVPKDEDEALKWLKKATDAGDRDAKEKYETIMQRRDALTKTDKPAKNGQEFMSVFKELPAGKIRDQYCQLNRQVLISNLRAELDGRAGSILWMEHSDPSFCFVENWKDSFSLDDMGWREVMYGVPLKKSKSHLWLAAYEHLKSTLPPDDTNTPRIAKSVAIQGRELWDYFTEECKGKNPTDLKLQRFANDAVGDFVWIENAKIFTVSADRVSAYVKLPNSEVKIRVLLTHIVPPKTRNASGNILDDYLTEVANRDNSKNSSFDPSEKLFDKMFKHTNWLDLEEGQNATIYGYIKNDNDHPSGVNVEGRIHIQEK